MLSTNGGSRTGSRSQAHQAGTSPPLNTVSCRPRTSSELVELVVSCKYWYLVVLLGIGVQLELED